MPRDLAHVLLDYARRVFGYRALCGATIPSSSDALAPFASAVPEGGCETCTSRAALVRLGVRFAACAACDATGKEAMVRFAAVDSEAPCPYCEGQGVYPIREPEKAPW